MCLEPPVAIKNTSMTDETYQNNAFTEIRDPAEQRLVKRPVFRANTIWTG